MYYLSENVLVNAKNKFFFMINISTSLKSLSGLIIKTWLDVSS